MPAESPLAFIRHRLEGIYPPTEIRSLTRLLVEDGLGMQMLDFYTGKVKELSEEKETKLREMLARLARYEPIQYVVGKTEFDGLTFHTAPGVLIPRPETEELVDWICESAAPARILDAGTGSGCIAIALARRFPNAEVDAWDISPEAMRIAEGNNRLNGTHVHFFRRDILADTPMDETPHRYDLLVSNPPYVMQKERGGMARNVLDWEPEAALFVPDDDPLLFYRALARLGKRLLVNGGRIYLEINCLLAKEMTHMLEAESYSGVVVRKDLFGKDRMVSAINP